MKQVVKVSKCRKCRRTVKELAHSGVTYEQMTWYIPVGGQPEKETVLEVCSDYLKDAGLLA